MEIQKITNCKYLSEFIDILPSGYIINKGITGCGGTTLELESKRDSIILCPTRNLVTSKASLGYFGVDGTITKKEITNYLITHKGYKKIVATYDALEKLMETIPDYQNYFLLIDEYHLLFNDYSFRDKAILYILNNFKQFKQFAFLTATPLKEEFILDELKDLPQITYEWDNAVPVRINIRDTAFTKKELLYLINVYKDRNLHIFLNSVATIRNIVNKLDIDDYRVVCSETSKTKISHFAKVTDPICKINFYTSCSFEGCLLPDEGVLTEKGLKKAKDITLDDKLINKEGDIVDIKNIQEYDKVEEDVYTLKLGNTFRTTTFTGNHPIFATPYPLKLNPSFIKCKDLRKNYWIKYPNIYNKEKELDPYIWDKYKSESTKDIPNLLDDLDFWWFIGLFIGDGWTQNDGYRVFISINRNETKTIERLKKFCNKLNRNYRLKSSTSGNCDEYIINCKQLVDFLNDNFHKYALGKRIPEMFKYIKKEYKVALLNGYLDSDGCLLNSNNSYRISFVSINLLLLEDIQDILSSLGLKSSLKKLRDAKETTINGKKTYCKETYDLNISHNDVVKFYNMLEDKDYQKLSKFDGKLKSKNPRFVNMDFSDDLKYIYFKIKEITISKYSGKVYNYECETHSYCCRHITTHNCDLYDPNGYSIILSDTNIALTVLDIATKVRQICGRIRDSKYKDEVTIILNTNKHRYAGTTEKDFYNHVAESERLGKIKESAINRFSPDELLAEMKTYNKESYSNIYLNRYDNKIFYDENLKKLDIYNYKLISEIYNNTISVISEINNNKYLKVESVKKTLPPKGLSFIIDKLKELNKSEYTYDELTEIFTPIFKEHKLNWNSNSSIRLYFPECKKVRKTIKDRKLTYYKFDI